MPREHLTYEQPLILTATEDGGVNVSLDLPPPALFTPTPWAAADTRQYIEQARLFNSEASCSFVLSGWCPPHRTLPSLWACRVRSAERLNSAPMLRLSLPAETAASLFCSGSSSQQNLAFQRLEQCQRRAHPGGRCAACASACLAACSTSSCAAHQRWRSMKTEACTAATAKVCLLNRNAR